MRGYLKYFKTELMVGLQYKAAAIAGICTQLFWGFLFCLLYEAFYSYANVDAITYREVITYVWLMQAFFSLIYIKIEDAEIIGKIKSGTVAYELCRPYNIYFWWFVRLLSRKYAHTLLKSFPVFVFAFMLPSAYRLSFPISFEALILFIITIILGSFIVVGISMLIHIISFFTLESKGIASIIASIGGVLSGMAVPVPLLPLVLINITKYLPFRLIGDTSFRIYSGNIGIIEAKQTIILQLIWVVILIGFGLLLLNKALKKVCLQGG